MDCVPAEIDGGLGVRRKARHQGAHMTGLARPLRGQSLADFDGPAE